MVHTGPEYDATRPMMLCWPSMIFTRISSDLLFLLADAATKEGTTSPLGRTRCLIVLANCTAQGYASMNLAGMNLAI